MSSTCAFLELGCLPYVHVQDREQQAFNVIHMCILRFEVFALCACLYLLSFGIGIEAQDVKMLFHKVFERVLCVLKKGNNFFRYALVHSSITILEDAIFKVICD